MASILEKAISILAGNLNSGRSYIITTVHKKVQVVFIYIPGKNACVLMHILLQMC